MANIEIRPLGNTKKEIKKFVTSAWQYYKDNPYWVPPLISEQVEFIHNGPYHEVGFIQPFMAYRNGKPVGRIIAHYDTRHNEHFGEKRGCVGFFESINDRDVSRALFDASRQWLRKKGMEDMQGPFNFTLYDSPGILVDDFNNIPAVELGYNPEYYPELFTDYGFQKSVDWHAYLLTVDRNFPNLFYKFWEKVRKDAEEGKDGLVIRNVNLKNFDYEKDRIFKVFNRAWEDNWGHYPLTAKQFDKFAQELKMVMKPELVMVAEYNDEIAGVIVSIPDVNIALQKANGRLFPFGLFRILLNMRKIKRIKTIIMGVMPEYRMRGLDVYFYVESFERARKMGYDEADLSLVVENNDSMRNALTHMGAEIYKTYRMYKMSI
jgi:GNAT superfamily N-acetyltransferase